MKIYISGPITGTEDYRERFRRAEIKLREEYPKCEMINPVKVNAALPETTTWKQYMKMSLFLLEMSDGIFMLQNWKKSAGACMEYGFALAKDKIIINESEEEN